MSTTRGLQVNYTKADRNIVKKNWITKEDVLKMREINYTVMLRL